MGYAYGMMGYDGHLVLGALWFALVTVALMLLVIWLWRQLFSSPLDALKTRYAKGEISKKDYEQMKKELG